MEHQIRRVCNYHGGREIQENWMQLSGCWSRHAQHEQWRDTDWMKINIDGVFVEQSWQSVAVIGFVTHDEKKGDICYMESPFSLFLLNRSQSP